jgi:hypothetical protein
MMAMAGSGGGKGLVVNQLRADTELARLVEIVLGTDDTGDVSFLWTGDVPLEGESHVAPVDS